MRSDERNGATVLERAFRVLEVFGPEERSVGLAEMARRAKLPKATAFRLAKQLVELGALERSAAGYHLGMRLFELGSQVSCQRRLRDAALPLMEDLYEATHEIVHLAIPDGIQMLYIEKIMGRNSGIACTQIGTRRPMHCTALGKAVLARSEQALVQAVLDGGLVRYTPYTISTPQRFLDELEVIRREGVAYDREEFHLGVTCVAAAVLGPRRTVEGALSITGLPGRFHAESKAGAVRTAALALSRALGYTPAVA